VLSLGLGAGSALCCAGADQVTFHVGEASEYGQHQAPGAGAGVSPRLSQRSELRLGVHDPLDDAEQVEGAAGQAVNPSHRHHVAGDKPVEHAKKFGSVGPRARYVLAVDVPAAASGCAQLFKLVVEGLPVGADAGIADKALFAASSGHSYGDVSP